MIQPYVGEVRMFAGSFAPDGWLVCDGALLPVSGNEALFALLGTQYGGDGVDTFAIPDLRGRIPVHAGNGIAMAEAGGAEEVQLGVAELPAHAHGLHVSSDTGTEVNAAGNLLCASPSVDVFTTEAPDLSLSPASTSTAGGSGAHANVQPFLCVNFIISLFGSDPTVL